MRDALDGWLESIADRGDARAFFELGNWSWMAAERRSSRARNLDRAIGYIEKGLDRIGEGDDLTLHLKNRLAYFLGERNVGGDLERAEGVVAEVEASNRPGTDARHDGERSFVEYVSRLTRDGFRLAFLDTAGFIHGLRAEASDIGREKWQRKAIDELEQVLREGTRLVRWQRGLVQRHLDRVKSLQKLR